MLLLIWLFTFDRLRLEGEHDEGEDLVYLLQRSLLLSDQFVIQKSPYSEPDDLPTHDLLWSTKRSLLKLVTGE